VAMQGDGYSIDVVKASANAEQAAVPGRRSLPTIRFGSAQRGKRAFEEGVAEGWHSEPRGGHYVRASNTHSHTLSHTFPFYSK
jgi:hypothetical protein